MERKLATIRKITSIEDIPNADFIQLCRVDGWQSVIKKGDFQVGDIIIFVEIDSVLKPEEWNKFLWDKKEPTKDIRIKTCRLKNTLSQGVVFPLSIIYDYDGSRDEGKDVTEYLKITKYEPIIPANLSGKVRGNFPTHLFPKTDSERCQNLWNPSFLEEIDGVKFYITHKMDGTSCSIFKNNNDIGVCSRNLQLDLNDEKNVYVQIFKYFNFKEILEKVPFNISIQMEIVGEGIQKNTALINKKQYRVFDVYNIDEQRYLNFNELQLFCAVHDLIMVDIFKYDFIFNKNLYTINDLLKLTEQTYSNTKNQIEGLVFTPVEEKFSNTIKGRLRFKLINPNYLLKNES
jgi:RNA ligase (TIGR02306 family)